MKKQNLLRFLFVVGSVCTMRASEGRGFSCTGKLTQGEQSSVAAYFRSKDKKESDARFQQKDGRSLTDCVQKFEQKLRKQNQELKLQEKFAVVVLAGTSQILPNEEERNVQQFFKNSGRRVSYLKCWHEKKPVVRAARGGWHHVRAARLCLATGCFNPWGPEEGWRSKFRPQERMDDIYWVQ